MATSAQLLKVARGYLGCREVPYGSNDGTCVREIQSSTGAYRAPWCVSFVQRVLQKIGVGTVANRTAGVFYMVDYAHQHGWLRSVPKPGHAVAFMRGQGHIGFVDTILGPTSFTTVEGNAGNAVTRRYHTRDSTMRFIQFPGVADKPPKPVYISVRVPRFRAVTKVTGKPLTSWQKWDSLERKLPVLLVKNQNRIRLQRKVIKVKKRQA